MGFAGHNEPVPKPLEQIRVARAIGFPYSAFVRQLGALFTFCSFLTSRDWRRRRRGWAGCENIYRNYRRSERHFPSKPPLSCARTTGSSDSLAWNNTPHFSAFLRLSAVAELPEFLRGRGRQCFLSKTIPRRRRVLGFRPRGASVRDLRGNKTCPGLFSSGPSINQNVNFRESFHFFFGHSFFLIPLGRLGGTCNCFITVGDCG